MHICDWYSTMAHVLGLDPTDKTAAAAGLPPIDSLNMWPMISGVNATSPRLEIPLSSDETGTTGGLISGRYKIVGVF